MTTNAGPNVLIFEDQPGALALNAHLLVREGYAISYASDVDEARLIASEWAGEIRVLVFPDPLDERALGGVIGALKSIPRLISVGEMPSTARRGELFELGVSWGIWDPPEFRRLRTAVDVSLDLAPIVFGQTPFVLTNLAVRIRDAGDSDWAAGTLHLLSRNGAFVETGHRARSNAKLELELLAPGPPVALRGRLAIDNADATLPRWPRGLGVSLRYPNDEARAAVHAFIGADRSRYWLVD